MSLFISPYPYSCYFTPPPAPAASSQTFISNIPVSTLIPAAISPAQRDFRALIGSRLIVPRFKRNSMAPGTRSKKNWWWGGGMGRHAESYQPLALRVRLFDLPFCFQIYTVAGAPCTDCANLSLGPHRDVCSDVPGIRERRASAVQC